MVPAQRAGAAAGVGRPRGLGPRPVDRHRARAGHGEPGPGRAGSSRRDRRPPPCRRARGRDRALRRAQSRRARAAPRRAAEVLPGGNTRSVLHFDPVPARLRARRRRASVLARRRPLRRLPGRVHGRALRPLAPGHPRRGAVRAGPRHQLRRHERPRARAGRAAVPALRGAGAGPLHQLRHRGEPDGAGARRPPHRPARDPGLQGRLPRRRAGLRERRAEPGHRAARLRHGRLRRRRGDPRADPLARAGGDPRGADAGLGRLHPGVARVPGDAARGGDRDRRGADLRRGHDLAARPVGRRPRPHDGRQVPGGRDVVRRLRRAARADVGLRPDAGPARSSTPARSTTTCSR